MLNNEDKTTRGLVCVFLRFFLIKWAKDIISVLECDYLSYLVKNLKMAQLTRIIFVYIQDSKSCICMTQ